MTRNATVLVVEDDDAAREEMVEYLAERGHAVLQAKNGKAALGLCREGAVDVLVTDLFMPEIKGLELIPLFRELQPAARIVTVSGGSSWMGMDFLEVARLLGADRVMSKPLVLERLAATIGELLKTQRPDAR